MDAMQYLALKQKRRMLDKQLRKNPNNELLRAKFEDVNDKIQESKPDLGGVYASIGE